ncbi:type I restriction enzyme M protein [Bacillus sp. RC240]|uniref:HsdM family class I SAM-dependent methyltransferase n=1 Tax=Bacillus sp. RC240 TaxID=3156285 RepID=UPI0038365F62
MGYEEYLTKIKIIIDELKAMCSDLGLSNTGDEYKIISELFTYKFLNDKLKYEFENREDKDETFDEFVDLVGANTAKMRSEHLIENLYQLQNKQEFHKTFDKVLVEISDMNIDIYSIETVTGQKKGLFDPLSNYIRDEKKEVELAKRAINILVKEDFPNIYEQNFDFFSSIFEYLIKDYNKDSGKYAEYFTPAFAGNIMAEILADDKDIQNVSLYDPSAGSGTLVLCLANVVGTQNCTIFTQDISQKSSQFLRINLILNNLAHSLHNVIEGNTLTVPGHLNKDGNLKKFDYIVSNPPFNTDFSAIVIELENDLFNRFFAGIPNVPNKKKDSMAIYQVFLQHILASLSDKGKAAVVVPTSFCTAASGIPKTYRKKLIDDNLLRGVIHMPSNIFATTGTSVSIIFIDKEKTTEDVMLIDASGLGTKTKLEDGQRTLLSKDEIQEIIETFKKRIEKPEFSKVVENKLIKGFGYSVQAAQYVEHKVEEIGLDVDDRIAELSASTVELLDKSAEIEIELRKILKVI